MTSEEEEGQVCREPGHFQLGDSHYSISIVPQTRPALAGPVRGIEFKKDRALLADVQQASPFFKLYWMTEPGGTDLSLFP